MMLKVQCFFAVSVALLRLQLVCCGSATVDANKYIVYCSNGDPFYIAARCNVIRECLDGSDELGCDYAALGIETFTCDDGTHLLKSWQCDGNKDCTDGSDEKGCFCRDGFLCDNETRCINKSFICDNDLDCKDGSDERNDSCILAKLKVSLNGSRTKRFIKDFMSRSEEKKVK